MVFPKLLMSAATIPYSTSTRAFCLELFLEANEGAIFELIFSIDVFFAKKSSLFPSASLKRPFMITIFNCCSITKLLCWIKSSSSFLCWTRAFKSLILWTFPLRDSVLSASFRFLRVLFSVFYCFAFKIAWKYSKSASLSLGFIVRNK